MFVGVAVGLTASLYRNVALLYNNINDAMERVHAPHSLIEWRLTLERGNYNLFTAEGNQAERKAPFLISTSNQMNCPTMRREKGGCLACSDSSSLAPNALARLPREVRPPPCRRCSDTGKEKGKRNRKKRRDGLHVCHDSCPRSSA